MENDPLLSSHSPQTNGDKNSEGASASRLFEFPPKPQQEDKKGNVWIRSLTSLALYILIGYYFFSANWLLLLILTVIVIFHELGHFFAMKMYDYQDLGIFFIPLLGAYASGTKREVSQKQSAVILLAGPMPGIILGIALYLIATNRHFEIPFETVLLLKSTAGLLIFLNVLNLLPIYPLDGGQLLNRLFLDESKLIAKIFVVLSACVLAWLALFGLGRPFYPLLVFPAMLLFRLRADTKFDELTKKVEERGINLEKSYEELSDEDYWNIRNILIENNPGLKNINPAPPYEYSVNEDKVVTAIENILQRTIVQDLSLPGKLLIIAIWVGSFAAPFLLDMDLPFLHYRS